MTEGNGRPPSSGNDRKLRVLRTDVSPVSGAELRVLAAVHALDVRVSKLETYVKIICGLVTLVPIGLQIWSALK